jgi:hypothetical protein
MSHDGFKRKLINAFNKAAADEGTSGTQPASKRPRVKNEEISSMSKALAGLNLTPPKETKSEDE